MTSGPQARVVAGRYQLQRQLGRGGMGVVWQAWDPELEREVAIKEVLLPEELTPEERTEMHARTRREARSAAKLTHPSIITIHDVLDFEEHPWIVMELVSGQALNKVLKERGSLPPERVSAIARSLLDALLLAHSKGVIHRDIKPGNVMLADNGRVILTDFGIATIEGETSITRSGALVGSPEYMAPERLQQESAEASSDLWSLGATLYAATEGQSPFKRDTVTASISAVMSAPVPPPQHAGPLAPILMGMLDRDPANRLTAQQASQLLAMSVPTGSMAPPTGANPTMAATGAMPPPNQQYPPQHPQFGVNGPPGPNGANGGPAAAGGSNKRKVYAVVAAAAAVLVLVAAVALWAITRPAETEYRLYQSSGISFEYPADWTAEEDEGRITVTHHNTLEEISFTASSYTPDEENPVDEMETKSDGDWETTDEDGYEEETLERVDQDYLPDSWTAAEWVYRYVHDDAEHPNRYSVRRQLHYEQDFGGVEAVWLRWDLPEEQATEYQGIIGHVNRSLRP
ncbi:serine/threonine-protein kinase [Halostreptopolyspora alba]|uniref:serine/threonine-protein kinase n=1 Tax=Halostreptopolyspora alba TaxID=2487137 RepID=UPI0026D580DD